MRRSATAKGSVLNPASQCHQGAFSQVSSELFGFVSVIPKLRARVRFSSPAPRKSPGPMARGFLVVRTGLSVAINSPASSAQTARRDVGRTSPGLFRS